MYANLRPEQDVISSKEDNTDELLSLISSIRSDVVQMAVQCGHVDGGLSETNLNCFERDGVRSILKQAYVYENSACSLLDKLRNRISIDGGDENE